MSQPTWRSLLGLLGRAAIVPDTCFFTNFYMGLRKGRATTGVFPGASDAAFRTRCLDFLKVQLLAYRPQVVLTLGRFVPSLIGRLAPALNAWSGPPSFRRIDEVGALRDAVIDTGTEILNVTFAALTHPSLRHLSVSRRTYGRKTGDAAELAMLANACRSFCVYGSARREL